MDFQENLVRGWVSAQNRPLLTFGVDPAKRTDPGIFFFSLTQDRAFSTVTLICHGFLIDLMKKKSGEFRWLVSFEWVQFHADTDTIMVPGDSNRFYLVLDEAWV